MKKLSVNIDAASVKWAKAFPRMSAKIEKAATRAFLDAKKPATFQGRIFEINIVLTTDLPIKKLNKIWRGKDKATNVLSFPQLDLKAPLPRGAKIKLISLSLGDVVLAFETIKRESVFQKKTLEQHTLHLVVHGILHLLGYDHMSTKDATAMEKLECDILHALGYPDPYHET